MAKGKVRLLADVSLANWDDMLYNFRVPMQRNFSKRHVLRSELKRIAPAEIFSGGDEARIPVILSSLQGGGNPGESGTVNVPHNFSTAKAVFTLEDVYQPIGITLRAEENSNANSAAPALRTLVEECENALAEVVNDQYNAAGALLATVASATGSPGLVVPTDPATTNYERLYPNRVVDLLTITTGANPGNGLRRKIASVNRTTGDITFATAQSASDGDSGDITFAGTTGIYLPGTYGRALQSIEQIASATGTFEGIDRAVRTGWQAVDGRNGDTTVKMLSDTLLDAAVEAGGRYGDPDWEFALAQPRVINGYKQTKYALTRINPTMKKLSGGFAGIEYVHANGTIALVSEYRATRKRVVLVPTKDIAIYHGPAHPDGPEWVVDTGSRWQRFGRTPAKEAWWRDVQQLAAKRCNRTVFLANLDEAA